MSHNTELYEDCTDYDYDCEITEPVQQQIGPAEFAVAIRLYSAEYKEAHDLSWSRFMRRLHNEQVLVACYANLN